ncbi:cupredoxin domain-containing protein [Paenibacillus terrigena]|uniref:cupredoxin domain-containing protein n=1 Tax=Paenibacillus terrigena TaxID=369333 RepID=UPI0028D5F00F|nr:cupredoxin domain-containing protein [Paenibacillus terrigena]
MLLNIGSFILIGLITGYHVYYLFHRKAMLAGTAGAVVASVLSGLSGLACGALVVQSFDYVLIVSLGIASLFAIIAGFLNGLPLGVQTAIHGMLSGTLGAMFGVVLGSLFFPSKLVVLGITVVFILCFFFTQKMGDSRLHVGSLKKKKAQKGSKRKPVGISTIVLAACVVLTAGYILSSGDQLRLGAIGMPQFQVAAVDEENDLQVATMELTASGFSPKTTEFKAGSMIKAIFKVSRNAGSGLRLVSKDLNFSADLKPGENIFVLNNPQPGTYEIVESTKGYKCNFTVKDFDGAVK